MKRCTGEEWQYYISSSGSSSSSSNNNNHFGSSSSTVEANDPLLPPSLPFSPPVINKSSIPITWDTTLWRH